MTLSHCLNQINKNVQLVIRDYSLWTRTATAMAETGLQPHQPLIRSSKRRSHVSDSPRRPRRVDSYQQISHSPSLSGSPRLKKRPWKSSTLTVLQATRPTISGPANAEGKCSHLHMPVNTHTHSTCTHLPLTHMHTSANKIIALHLTLPWLLYINHTCPHLLSTLPPAYCIKKLSASKLDYKLTTKVLVWTSFITMQVSCYRHLGYSLSLQS